MMTEYPVPDPNIVFPKVENPFLRPEPERAPVREPKVKEPPAPPESDFDEESVEFVGENLTSSDLERVAWVYDHIGDKNLPTTGPDDGALAMLRWARKNRKEFYSLWTRSRLSKSVLEKEREDTRKRRNKDLRGKLTEIAGAAP